MFKALGRSDLASHTVYHLPGAKYTRMHCRKENEVNDRSYMIFDNREVHGILSVSYTHLPLPTKA